ncbi:MAG: hypothetical protein AAGF33_03765 [Pseudomonadota bacterium]
MILRRLTEHVKAQNWTAVALDFAIVVVGVFMGIQLGNWNEARGSAQKEAIILSQLKEEFEAAERLTQSAHENNETYINATVEVLRALQLDQEPADKAAFLQTIYQAGQFGSVPIEPTTLTELISSGGLSDLSSADLRRALIRYHELMVVHQQSASLVLERISTPHDGFHGAVLVNPDFRIEGEAFLADYDWARLKDAREQFQVLIYGKLGLSSQMATLSARIETILSEIEEAQKEESS